MGQAQDTTTRNKLLRFIAPANAVLYDKKLSLEVIYPYKAFQEINKKPQDGASNQNWCNMLTNLLTEQATELEHDVLFQELASTLQLRGDLLAV